MRIVRVGLGRVINQARKTSEMTVRHLCIVSGGTVSSPCPKHGVGVASNGCNTRFRGPPVLWMLLCVDYRIFVDRMLMSN